MYVKKAVLICIITAFWLVINFTQKLRYSNASTLIQQSRNTNKTISSFFILKTNLKIIDLIFERYSKAH